MKRFVDLAKGTSSQFTMREVHGLQLAYRILDDGRMQLLIPLGGRAVVSSFCRSCTTQPMLGTWVLVKCLKLCNRGSGGLKCSSMLSRL